MNRSIAILVIVAWVVALCSALQAQPNASEDPSGATKDADQADVETPEELGPATDVVETPEETGPVTDVIVDRCKAPTDPFWISYCKGETARGGDGVTTGYPRGE